MSSELNGFLSLIVFILMLNGPKLSYCEDLTDLTVGLSDEDINSALSDLSLSDLQQLERAVYDSDSVKAYNVEPQMVNTPESYTDDVDYPMGAGFAKRIRSIFPPMADPRYPLYNGDNDNSPRTKRNSVPSLPKMVSDEYIKQLDYSFPGSAQLNDENEYFEMKRNHIRVKRN